VADQPTAVTTLDDPRHKRPPLPSLTGLRFLAALLVVLTHTSLLNNPLRPQVPVSFFADQGFAKWWADFCLLAGPIGVSFFFVLSGFVLTWSATPGDGTGAFWRRRAVKIYPNQIVTWGLSMVLFAAATTPISAWLPNLFLVHAYSNNPVILQSVNFPSWSLCSEVLFYALFPLLIVLVRRISDRRLWLWAVVMVAGVALVPILTPFVHGGPLIPNYGLTTNQMWFAYPFPPPRLFEFVLGMVLARIVMAGKWPRVGLLPSAVVFAVGYGLTLVLPKLYGLTLTTILGVAMIICAAASSDLDGGGGGWLRSRVMVWLGTVSFAFYLVQGPVIFYSRTKFLGTFDIVPAFALSIALILVNLFVAWLLYSLVEKPMMRRFSRSRKRPSTGSLSTVAS
jgi:peptidoglycan/LPS O-acetylase OafA/YrhL